MQHISISFLSLSSLIPLSFSLIHVKKSTWLNLIGSSNEFNDIIVDVDVNVANDATKASQRRQR